MTERTSFNDLPISNEIKRAVAEMGFEEATFIQSQSIPLILEGHDIIGQSQTGTGKTAAFGIPIIEKINPDLAGHTQVLILCPTRELAIQGCEELRKFAKYKHSIGVVPIYGGQLIDRQINSLKKGAEIVIGTPGRIMDHLRRRTLKLPHLSMIVLDEADEMLNMGFREDIETILKDVPEGTQNLLFSATMPPEIMKITHQYQNDPKIVKLTQKQVTVPNIRQFYYEVPNGKKIETLARLLDFYNPKRSMVFCNTKRMVDELVGELQFRGYAPDGLHGDMKQQARTTVMNSFKSGKVDILIATDVAARGIDVDDIDVVFNFDLPQDPEYYIHRIGRTGRAGKSGISCTLVVGRHQLRDIRDIEQHIKTKIELKKIPSIDEINEVRNDKLIESLLTILKDDDFRKYEPLLDRLISQEYTTVEIASAALALLSEHVADDIQLDTLIQQQKSDRDTKSRKQNSPDKHFKKDKSDKSSDTGTQYYVINVGTDDKVKPKHIVDAITDVTGLPAGIVGNIMIHASHAIVEIQKNYSDLVYREMKGSTIKGKTVAIKSKRNKSKKNK
ncbi:MAG: DEAD/DEAH box helicase [Defluviitaleaceae bacterium]|nr:DEAD/DEAH box helicase [Defluviitaleaceae bacterium]